MNSLTGIALKIGSAFLFTIMSALVKWVGDTIPTGQIVFARSFFAIIPIVVMIAMQREFHRALKTHRVGGHAVRAFVGVFSMFCSFAALSYLPLPDVTAIGYAAPLIAVVLAVLILKETVRVYRWTAVVIGLVGVIIMLLPHLGGVGTADSMGALLALLGASAAALAVVQVRRLTMTENTSAIVFYFSACSALIGLATLPLGWAVPDAREAAVLVTIGLIGGIAQILLTQSYRYADASLIAPFEYTTILWATAIGYVVFGDVPSALVALGATIVIGAGVFVILRERRLGIERNRSRRAAPPA